MTTLFLIRHGANDFTQAEKLAGWLPDVHLNDQGHTQAQHMAARMDQVKLAAIYSSPLERAVETAQYLAGPRGLEIQPQAGLGEIRIGEWEGQKVDDLNKTDAWRMFQIYPSGARPPGGESGRQVQQRAVDQVEAICAAHPQDNVAIVSHADTIKTIVAHYAGMHLDMFQRLDISPASVSVIWIGPKGPRLVRLNDAGPLADIQPPAERPEPDKKQ